MARLHGKQGLVTGAGRGIGRAIALALASEGADLILTARDTIALKAIAERCRREFGVRAEPCPCDLTDDNALDALIQQVEARFGGLDLLINNAGTAEHYPIPEIPIEVWDRTMRLNLRVPFLLTRAFWPAMVRRGGGVIVNIASISGKRASAFNAAYAASKFGLIGFSESCLRAGREVNIRVHVVCPGGVATPLRAKNYPGEDPSRLLRPEDVAEVVRFLVTLPAHVSIPEVVVEVNPSGLSSC
ncbi:MAG: 3-oxoacyl-ACP reductase [Candidatus Poribacteria bacterium]|nr:MAG: 3-oxoacyl-ACP reductase [Candidatus Poribacteria bacterium]